MGSDSHRSLDSYLYRVCIGIRRKLGIHMVEDWDRVRPPRHIRTWVPDDCNLSDPPDHPPQNLRTDKDQTMDQETPTPTYRMTAPSGEKPWILKRASNWVSGLRNADRVGINPKDALGAAKVPMHLVPSASIICQALCMDDGNIKYGPYNVRMEDIQAIGYIAAAMRHLEAYKDGQDFDPITGKPHLGYALATIGLVIDAWLNGTLIDNRPV